MNQLISKTKSRRKYDNEFKRQAVEHWRNSNKTAVAVGRELGIDPNRLYTWKERLAPPPPGSKGGGGAKPSAQELQAENAQLRRDNEALRQQREILKKLWASSQNPRTTLPTD